MKINKKIIIGIAILTIVVVASVVLFRALNESFELDPQLGMNINETAKNVE